MKLRTIWNELYAILCRSINHAALICFITNLIHLIVVSVSCNIKADLTRVQTDFRSGAVVKMLVGFLCCEILPELFVMECENISPSLSLSLLSLR